jgi:DNA invertase Pin-like site-specific DNA recombinase
LPRLLALGARPQLIASLLLSGNSRSNRIAPGDVVITRPLTACRATHLLVIAGDMQRAGAGIRSLAEPFLDTTSDFAKIIFAILGVASKLERALMSKDR